MKEDRILSRRTLLRGLAGTATGFVGGVRTLAAPKPALLEVGGGSIEVGFDSQEFDLQQTAILDWVSQCARTVTAYMGRFPVKQSRVQILLSERGPAVSRGVSWGGPIARCRIAIGRRATADDLRRDWVLIHEMLHFAFPSVAEPNHWIEEGISTYVEPIARAMTGLLTPQQVWTDMVRDMPKGLPETGDQGLDVTHTWARTYWGGALFCLLADVGIRRGTQNRSGLREALRAINNAGGNITVEWPILRALQVGDKATGVTVLSDLYRGMGSSSYPVDLPALWTELGVIPNGAGVVFNERASLAAIRSSMIKTSRSG